MSYDLTRLCRKVLIQRLSGRNRHVLTPDGHPLRAVYTKVHNRLLLPLLAADHPPAPPALHDAPAVIHHSVNDYVRIARLEAA
jgi:hypothetical protein